MRNITIALPDDIARKARVWAAEADTSISQYMASLLTERMERESGYRQAQNRFLKRAPVLLQKSSRPYPVRDDLHDRAHLR